MFTGRSLGFWWILGVNLLFLFSPAHTAGEVTGSVERGKAIFQEKCTACHTIGGGKLVGPDLQGVTARRDRAWLARWIKEPDKMLGEEDPIATSLLQEFNNVPMPNLGLTDEEAVAILDYLESVVAGTTVPQPAAIPVLYFPTLIAALVALGGLTAVGLLAARKSVEVRP